jgi:hypothetical protein
LSESLRTPDVLVAATASAPSSTAAPSAAGAPPAWASTAGSAAVANMVPSRPGLRASRSQSCQASARGAGSDGRRRERSFLARQWLSSAIQASPLGSRPTAAFATCPARVEAVRSVRVGMRSRDDHA